LYSNVRRSGKYITSLSEFIRREYQIVPIAITPAKRGFYGETWRLEAAAKNYFIKIDYSPHKEIYKRSFPVIDHLYRHGITSVSKIVNNANGELFSDFDSAILGVFDWIDGENVETDATKIPEYQILAKVYAVPVDGVPIHREDFSYKNADKFFGQWNSLKNKQLLSLLEKNRSKLESRAGRLKKFAELCRGDTMGFVITHGDAGGNFMVSGDKYFIVDWDNPVLAPPERDAWVMCGKDLAMDAFHDALRSNGVAYTLRPERLAYYCYDFFFFYLISYIDTSAQIDTVEEYINGWINESFEYADKIEG